MGKKDNGPKKILYINLERFFPWIGKVDIVDLAIATCIWDWKKWHDKYGNARLHPDDERYVWIDLQNLLSQMPFLRIEYDTLRKRLAHLRKLGILYRKHLWHDNGRRAVYYHVSEKITGDEPKPKQRKSPKKSLKGTVAGSLHEHNH